MARGIVPNHRGGGLAASAILALCLFAATVFSPVIHAEEAPAGGFVMQNRAPFAAIIGVPGRWPDTSDSLAEVAWNVSSHAMAENSGGFTAFADGETQSLTTRFQYPLSARLRVGVQLQTISHSGGFLDGLIDSWHDVFGLNEGVRPQLPHDQLTYLLQQQGTEIFRLDDSVSGFGDTQLGLAGELGSLERFAASDSAAGYFLRIPWRVALNVKLPTGDIEKLTGSGNTDFAAALGWRAPDDSAGKLRWWLDAGVVLPGGVDIDGLETESQVYYYDAAMTWRLLHRFDIILQVAGNTPLYSGDVSVLGESSAQLALGGLWNFSSRFGVRFGIYEDLLAETAPDIGVEVTLVMRRW